MATGKILLLLLLLLLLQLPSSSSLPSPPTAASVSLAVRYDAAEGTARVLPRGSVLAPHATVNYTQALFVDGWDRLIVAAVNSAKAGAFSAGFAEGVATQASIYTMYVNNYADWFGDGKVPPAKGAFTPAAVYAWLAQNWQWTKAQVEKRTNNASEFWGWVGTNVNQLEGLVAGYNHAAPAHQALTLGDFLLLNADGDVEALASAMNGGGNKTTVGASRRSPLHLRCSSMWKLADDNSDIFFGHATWDHFDMMVRTLKRYQWGSGDSAVRVSLSSSPGFLSSIDDFYLTSKGLAVIETTNGNMNADLWKLLTPSSVLSWVRANVANAVSSSAPQWTQLFSTENSGTYNNQWMVLDMNQFTPGEPLKPATFMILEQLPGSCTVEDKSAHLNDQRYWGSYNIPAIPSVWKASGFGSPSAGPAWENSHAACPRAVLMKSLNGTVQDVPSFQKFIRFNKGPADPDPHDARAGFGISARFDLVPPKGENFGLGGGIDGKMSAVSLARDTLQFWAQNGPTHDNVPPFDWANVSPASAPTHGGMPQKWDFPWVLF
jgi:hypothetical protein